jgi:hypothetical protein
MVRAGSRLRLKVCGVTGGVDFRVMVDRARRV